MSRKFDRQFQINRKVLDVLEDPYTMHYLAAKLIRKRPKYLPWLIWKFFLFVVLAPSTRKKSN
jgi:hypothetical protein